MKSNEVGTTLKHPETINGNVKNLSKRMKMKDKRKCHFYLVDYYPLSPLKIKENLILPLINRLLASFCLQNDTLKPKNQLLIRDCPWLSDIFHQLAILLHYIRKYRDIIPELKYRDIFVRSYR
jgi:hypothetical protein